MAAKIYTKTGDAGTTGLIGGSRVSKADKRMEAIGTVDELNAYTGWLRDQLGNSHLRLSLLQIQNTLFTVGANLASDSHKKTVTMVPRISHNDMRELEKEIDTMEKELPRMTHFILPGGNPAVSAAHIVRAICRRAERDCVRLKEDEVACGEIILPYLNRLSDYFFVLARYIAHIQETPEIKWIPGDPSKEG